MKTLLCTAIPCARTTSTTRPGGGRRAIPPSRRDSWRSRSRSAAARSCRCGRRARRSCRESRRDHGRQRRRGAAGAAPPRRAPPDPRPYPPAGPPCARGRRPALRALGAARLVRPRRLRRGRPHADRASCASSNSTGYGACSVRVRSTRPKGKPPCPTSRTKTTVDAIDMLKQDHDKVERAFKEFEKMDRQDAEACRQLIQTVCEDLKMHTTARGGSLLSRGARGDRRRGPDERGGGRARDRQHADRPAREHGPDDPNYYATFTVLGEYVRHHIKEEQSEMFPAAKRPRSTSPPSASACARARRNSPGNGESGAAAVRKILKNGQSSAPSPPRRRLASPVISRENGHAARPMNAIVAHLDGGTPPAHDGRRRAQHAARPRHPHRGVGLVGGVLRAARLRRSRARAGSPTASALSAIALSWSTTTWSRKRFRPGFEAYLSPRAMFAVYAALAAGFALSGRHASRAGPKAAAPA